MRNLEPHPPATSKYPMRFPVAEHEPQVDHVRTFPNAYELDENGMSVATHQPANFERGQLVRTETPVHVFKPITPMYDPTMLANPNWWAPAGAR